MATEFRPLREILRELGPLLQQKASGYFFIVTDDNHSCTIRLRGGQIDEVSFSRQRNDEAVQLLSQVSAARARFQPIAIAASGSRQPLGASAQQWLLGGFESDLSMAASATGMAANASVVQPDGRRRGIVEKIALNYFGPIASLLCDEAFAAAADEAQVLQQIASNLPSQDESRRFIAEARAALASEK